MWGSRGLRGKIETKLHLSLRVIADYALARGVLACSLFFYFFFVFILFVFYLCFFFSVSHFNSLRFHPLRLFFVGEGGGRRGRGRLSLRDSVLFYSAFGECARNVVCQRRRSRSGVVALQWLLPRDLRSGEGVEKRRK